MKRIGWALVCVLFAAAFVISGTSARADDQAKAMEAYAKAAAPGPQHKLLASMAGSWEYAAKMWPAPGAPAQEWKGTAERKTLMDGRFLHEEVTGEFGGMPFHGSGLNGYDNVQGKYVGTWIDNMSTGISRSVGTADATGKVITYEREEFDPLTKAKSKGRDVLHIVSNDKEVLEFHKALPDGKYFKMMEIVYTRKK
jgi:hypothetical protein